MNKKLKEEFDAIDNDLLQDGPPELVSGKPCGHKGCLSHISHPCEGCGRVNGKKVKYFVTLMWMTDDEFKSRQTIGFFDTFKGAEECLKDTWFCEQEYWANGAVIEEYCEGYHITNLMSLKHNRKWYKSDDPLNVIPHLIKEPKQPKQAKCSVGFAF